MSNVFTGIALLAILAAIYFLARTIIALVRKEPLGIFVKRIFIAVAVVIVSSVGLTMVQTPEEKATIKAKQEAKAQAEADKKVAEQKAAEEKRLAQEQTAKTKTTEQPAKVEKPKEPTPEELAAKEEARKRAEEQRAVALERERQANAEKRRQLEESLNDFNARFAENLGVGSIGVPSEQRSDAIIYPLDQTGEIYLSEKISGNNFTGLYIHVKEVRQDTVFAALVFYQAAIKAYTPYADPNAVFGGLGLDANLVDDLTNSKTFSIAEYTYSKKMIGKSLGLGISK